MVVEVIFKNPNIIFLFRGNNFFSQVGNTEVKFITMYSVT